MEEYLYLAIFTECSQNKYVVKFPDLEGCIVKSDSIEEGITKAKKALEECLFKILKDGGEIPTPKEAKDITLKEGEFLILVKTYENIGGALIEKGNIESQKSNSKYKSSQMLLEHLTKEYDKEDERSMKIDSRIPIFITIATFLGGFVFNIGGESLKKTYELGQKIYSIYIIIYVLCIISIIISILIFAWILGTKKYKRIETGGFLNEKINEEKIEKTAYELMQGYLGSLQNNIKVNDKKMKQYNAAIIFVGIGAILYIILKFIDFLIS